MFNVRARARVFPAAGRPLVHVGTAPTTHARPFRYARPPTAATTMADTVGFVLLHVACVAVLVVGVSIQAVVIAAVTYALRCFGVAAGFHRYFSHRSFQAGRAVQFSLALLGTLALQKGVLWWASTHRRHHAVADTSADVHSPHHRSFLYSHCGWFIDPANQGVDERRVRDLMQFPELIWLDRWRIVPIAAFVVGMWALGPTVFVWAFCVSTVALWHATLSTGSFSHRFGGYRNFDTPDDSRNNRVIAAILLGEGWHNNHHHRPRAANHGTRRTEPDPIYAGLRLLERLRLVSNLHRPPVRPAQHPTERTDPARSPRMEPAEAHR
jgi:stearoyl-CoA desaturase (delta-9 desaturase)